MSDSPLLVDFVIRLVNSVLNLHSGQVKFFGENINFRSNVRQNCGLQAVFQADLMK